MIKRGSLIIHSGHTKAFKPSTQNMIDEDYSKPSSIPIKKPPEISDNEANLISCITAQIRIEVDGLDIGKLAKGPQPEKRVDLAIAVDGKTIIIYVRTIKYPYQYMSLKPLSHLVKIIDQMASKGLCSLLFKDKTIIMIKEADAELLAIFIRRLKKSIDHIITEREKEKKAKIAAQRVGKSKAEIFHANVKAQQEAEERKQEKFSSRIKHLTDQEIIHKKEAILGALFQKRDAIKLMKNKLQEQRMNNLRNMVGTTGRKQTSLTGFFGGSSNREENPDFEFGIKRGLKEIQNSPESKNYLINSAFVGEESAHFNYLSRFPAELFHLVISFLNRDEKKNMALCRETYNMIKQTRHKLIFTSSSIQPSLFHRILRNSPNLKELHICFREGIYTQTFFNLPSQIYCFNNLQILNLLEVKRISDTSFIKVLNCCNFAVLRSVSINSTSPLSDNSTNYIAGKLKMLEEFHYGTPGGFRNEAIHVYSANIKPDQIAGMLFRFYTPRSCLTKLKIPTLNGNVGGTIGKRHNMIENLVCHSVCPTINLSFLNRLKFLRVLELGSQNENMLSEFNKLPAEEKQTRLEERRENLAMLLQNQPLQRLRLGGITLLSPGILQTIAFKQGDSLEWLGLHSDQLRDDILELLMTNLFSLKVLDFSGCPAVTGSFFYARDEELGPFKTKNLKKVFHSIPNYLEQQFKSAVWKLFPRCLIMRI